MACEKFSISQDHKSYFFPILHLKPNSSTELFTLFDAALSNYLVSSEAEETEGKPADRWQEWPQQRSCPMELRTGALGWRLLGIMGQEGNVQITAALNYSSCFQISFNYSKQQSQFYSQRKRNSLAGKGAELIWIPFYRDFPSSSDYLQVQTYLIDEHE